MRLTKGYLAPALVTLAVCLAGCESSAPRKEILEQMETVVDESIEQNEKQAKVPDSVSEALIPTIRLGTSEVPEDVAGAQRFDITVNNVPADQFFMSLVDDTPFNMVVHPEVAGTITLNLRNVTVPQVMEAARDVYGYEFVGTPYGFNVLPARLQARIYQINYLNISRRGSSQTMVSSGSLTQAGTQRAQTSRGFGVQVTDPGRQGREVLGTSITTEQPETSFWQELQASVLAIVGSAEGRSVVVNPQSGVVVVRALPNELREVEAFLTATQLVVQRQVILEAKILEVRLSENYQSGINWSSLLKPGNNAITASNIGGGSVLVNESGVSDIAGATGSINPVNPAPVSGVINPPNDPLAIDGAITSAFGGVFTLALQLNDFTAFIELLKTQGNVQVLSSPRVATMNNQKAVIKVGTDEFFVTDITSTTVTGTATTIQPDVTLTPFFSGIALDVTPQISQTGDVTLHIHPSVSDVVDQQKTVVIGDITQQIPLALSTVRESDSIVKARSGQVIVIGGLMQDLADDREAGAPGISDLPLLGRLFKHERKQSLKSELVILLRPIVVDDGSQWSGELGKSAKSLDGLREELENRDKRSPLQGTGP